MRSKETSRPKCALEALENRTMLSGVVPSGQDNDLVYDTVNHTTWVAYFDPAAWQLKARSRVDGGAWSAETILDQTPATQVGKLPSIALAPNGTIGVAYYDGSNADLKYVERSPATGTWGSPVVVEATNRVGNYPSLAFNSKSNPFISYWTDVTGGTDYLKLRWRDAGVWSSLNVITIDSGADVGRYSSLVINPTIGWAMSYVTGTGCKYAQQNGTGVALETVDSTGAPAYTSLAFDINNKPWVSYYRSTDTRVSVAKKTTSFTPQSVYGNKGFYTNLWFEPGGTDARLVFYEPVNLNTNPISGNNVRRFNYTSGVWQSDADVTGTTLFKGGGDQVSAVRGAGGAITFSSVSNIQTTNTPSYQSTLQLRDQADANFGKIWPAVTQSNTQPAPAGSNPAVFFNGALWIVGQDISNQSRDDAWYSTDNGVTWVNATAGLSGGAAFGSRFAQQVTVFNNELWLIGGRSGSTSGYLDDVWHSADGITWTQAASAVFPARAYHGAVVNNGRLYVIGGYNAVNHRMNDVWSTADGVTWQQEVAAGTTFTARQSFTTLSYAGRIWVIGGEVGGLSPVSNEVWSSADGINWLQANGGNSAAPMRTGASGVVFDNRMWVLGGSDSAYNASNQIFYSLDGLNWVQSATLPDARSDAAALVFNNKIWLIGGWVPVRGSNNEVLFSNP
ncbi:MAG: hypothetical protein JWN40_748 [Phycisphaerales bacterium]|nr:hypothetical protein [Phycisphaerales bacterium]